MPEPKRYNIPHHCGVTNSRCIKISCGNPFCATISLFFGFVNGAETVEEAIEVNEKYFFTSPNKVPFSATHQAHQICLSSATFLKLREIFSSFSSSLNAGFSKNPDGKTPICNRAVK